MTRTKKLPAWIYRGVWGVLARWFRVPAQPPTLPVAAGEPAESFQPAAGFLGYLKLQFWVVLVVIDVLILVGWIAITAASPTAGAILALPALVLAIVPDIVAYLAIHLRYDTTWYVMSRRSLRIRRGIWVIHETTITFENVQNVTVSQGPLQRWFGIADVLVETAGGGDSHGEHGKQSQSAHRGLIEGVADAPRIRDLLLSRLRASRTAGLGDESPVAARVPSWSSTHISLLRGIRDSVRVLYASRS